jgi:hypothetical protein
MMLVLALGTSRRESDVCGIAGDIVKGRGLYGANCDSEYSLEKEKMDWMIDCNGRRGMAWSDVDVEEEIVVGARRVYLFLGKAYSIKIQDNAKKSIECETAQLNGLYYANNRMRTKITSGPSFWVHSLGTRKLVKERTGHGYDH